MRLILLGAPGAGKGTQAEFIADRFGIPSLSTGNMLREAVDKGTDVGKEAKGYMESGALVPDEVIIGIIKERLLQPDATKGFILDGMPRTCAQAEALEDMGVDIDLVLNIDVDDDAIVRRLSGRRVCESCGASYHTISKPSKQPCVCDRDGGKLIIRKDDEPETILARLKTYHELTEPLIGFYDERKKLASVDGNLSVNETTEAVLKVLEERF